MPSVVTAVETSGAVVIGKAVKVDDAGPLVVATGVVGRTVLVKDADDAVFEDEMVDV